MVGCGKDLKIQSESNIEQMGKQIQGPSSLNGFLWSTVSGQCKFPCFSLTKIGLKGKEHGCHLLLMEKLGKQEIGRHVMCAIFRF